MGRYRLNVDYTLATESSDNGHAAFIPMFQMVTSGGASVTPLSATDLRSTAGTKSAVASGTSSVTILAANAVRKGATITNTDANALYLDLSGGTASSTSFSKSIATNEYYEVPFGYSGLITGAWAADGTGSALVTEFT